MAMRPIIEETPAFRERYAEIPGRLRDNQPNSGFNLEDLFTKEEWQTIGDGFARQRFGRRFGSDVEEGIFPYVVRNDQKYAPGGNEARYNYLPELHKDD